MATVMKTAFVIACTAIAAYSQMVADNPRTLISQGSNQTKAEKVNDQIYRAIGFGNTYLVTTREGNVIVDTSLPIHARRHVKLLKEVSAAPVRYIILTHAHGDHTGGVPQWTEPGTQIIAQRHHAEFMHYQKRLEGFLTARATAQFALPIPKPGPWAGNYAAKIVPTVLFDDKYEFQLGGLTFQLFHTPGETPDHLTVWIPQLRAAFTGDNYYDSFPNLYTLRGTEPRRALDYVSSLNRVIDLKPDIVLPSHGSPVTDRVEVERRLTQYRDAILYVHDAVVRGMNDGKDVYTLIREVRLPNALDVGESYGKLTWSVRGIYEGYVGWFDLNPATMYDLPPSGVYADLVKLAGGPEAVVKLATQRLRDQRLTESLRLTEAALTSEPDHRAALDVRLETLRALIAQCRNSNERGWLDFEVARTEAKLAAK